MRIRLAIVAAIVASIPALFVATPSASAATTPQPGECFNLPYFGPWGHADFDFDPAFTKRINDAGIRMEGIDPVRTKRGNSGLYMPIGWQQDHIDPCKGVYYPGGFRIIHEESGKVVDMQDFWLRIDGVYFNTSSGGQDTGEKQIGTYKLIEFMPGILTPRPFEGGIGPVYWPFYVAPGLSEILESMCGLKVPVGSKLGNLNAVVKFFP